MSFSLRDFWDKCFEADRRYRAGLRPKAIKQWRYRPDIPQNWDEMTLEELDNWFKSKHRRDNKFAERTILATEWLLVFHPERLPAWLVRHDAGLERIARERIEKRRGMSVEQWRLKMR